MQFVIEVFAPECVVCKYYIIGTWRVPGFSVISKIVLSLCLYLPHLSASSLAVIPSLSLSPPSLCYTSSLFFLSLTSSLSFFAPPFSSLCSPFSPTPPLSLSPPSLSFLRTSSPSLSPLPRLPLSPFPHPSFKYTNIIMINLNLK